MFQQYYDEKAIYVQEMTGERQTFAEWLEEIEAEGYHKGQDITAEQYIEECIAEGVLIKVSEDDL